MHSKFVKLAVDGEPSETPSDTPESSGTPTSSSGTTPFSKPEETDYQKLRREVVQLKKEKNREQANRDTRNRPSVKGSPTDQLIQRIVKMSGLMGKKAEDLYDEMSKRSYLVRRLLGTGLTEDDIVDYFNEAMNNINMPFSKIYDVFEKCLNSSRMGLNLKDSLDFAFAHYNRNANLEVTKYILDNAASLHKDMPNLGIMKILKNSMRAGSPLPFNIIAMGPENIDKFPIFNELLELALARPEEDQVNLIIQYQKKRDALQQAMEIDDRYKAVFQSLLSMEYLSAQKKITELVTTLFQLSTQSPEFMALRRILMQLQLGQGFLTQFYSDIQQTQTSKELERENEKRVTSSNNSKKIVAQQNSNIPQYLEEKDKNIISTQLLEPIIGTFKNILSSLQNNENQILEKSNDPKKIQIFQQQKQTLTKFISKISDLNANLTSNEQFSKQKFNMSFNYALNELRSFPYLDSYKAVNKKVSENKSVIKLAQQDQQTNFGTWNLDVGALNQTLGKGFQVGAIMTILGGLVKMDPLKSIGGAIGLYLYNNNKQKAQELQNFGLSAPVVIYNDADRIAAENNFAALLENFQDYESYLKIQNLLDVTTKTIDKEEQYLTNLMYENMVTAPGKTEMVPFGESQQVKDAYKSFLKNIREGLDIAQYYQVYMEKLIERVKTSPDMETLGIIGSDSLLFYKTTIEPFKIAIDLAVQKFNNLNMKYSSYVEIAGEMQQKAFEIRKLKAIYPEIEKYIASGVSIADIILMPGGLAERLRSVINQERKARDIIYSAIVKLRKESPGIQQSLSTSMNVKNLEDKTATASYDNLKKTIFSNLITESGNDFILNNPEKIADYITNNIKLGQTITNPQTQPSAEFEHYKGLIDKRQNLSFVFDYIVKDTSPKFTFAEKQQLLDMIRNITFQYYIDKLREINAGTDKAIRNKRISDLNNIIFQEKKLTAEQKSSLTGGAKPPAEVKKPEEAKPASQDTNLTPVTGLDRSKQGYESFEVTELAQKKANEILNSTVQQLNKELGSIEVKVPLSNDPKIFLKSLIQQYMEIAPRVDQLQAIYNRILTQGDISGISSIASHYNKFIKLSKNKKDVRLRDYWDKELGYGPWGTVLDEKPEHHDKTYEEEKELHPERISKFKIID